jgi:ankyrin repeat protein
VKKALIVVVVALGAVIAAIVQFILVLAGLFMLDAVRRERPAREYKPKNLAEAVQHKYATPKEVAAFLDRGEDVNQRVPAGSKSPVPLVALAASYPNHVEIVRLLIRHGAKADEAGLWWAARQGNEAMARMLVEEGASLGRQQVEDASEGPELIQAAAFGGQAWLVRLLIEKGADVQVVNAGGAGLLALALQNEYHDSVETTQALLGAGAHVDPRSDEEVPPLYWAAYHDKRKEVHLLLAAGAHVDTPAPKSRVLQGVVLPSGARITALAMAVEECHPGVAEDLLRHGASKSAVITDGKSLVEGACYHVTDGEKDKRERMRALLAR